MFSHYKKTNEWREVLLTDQASRDKSYFGYQAFPAYAHANLVRAQGNASIKESHKAAVNILKNLDVTWASIADIGCSAGHFSTALAQLLSKRSVDYMGVDMDEVAIQLATENLPKVQGVLTRGFQVGSISNLSLPTQSVDVVISMNVLEHMETLRPALNELLRVTRKAVILRTYIGEQTYLIREVRNRSHWSGDLDLYEYAPEPAKELDESGRPHAFVFQNIWGEDYFRAQISQISPSFKVTITPDTYFDEKAINDDSVTGALPYGTKVIAGKQVAGPLLVPHTWVTITHL
jgi:SAM-dependent methyltransferase